jgi:ribosomal protein L18E
MNNFSTQERNQVISDEDAILIANGLSPEEQRSKSLKLSLLKMTPRKIASGVMVGARAITETLTLKKKQVEKTSVEKIAEMDNRSVCTKEQADMIFSMLINGDSATLDKAAFDKKVEVAAFDSSQKMHRENNADQRFRGTGFLGMKGKKARAMSQASA